LRQQLVQHTSKAQIRRVFEESGFQAVVPLSPRKGPLIDQYYAQIDWSHREEAETLFPALFRLLTDLKQRCRANIETAAPLRMRFRVLLSSGLRRDGVELYSDKVDWNIDSSRASESRKPHSGHSHYAPRPARSPAAFLSYARFDDQHSLGRLTQLRQRLEGEVRARLGRQFAIFQDREDIGWGEAWRARIESAIEGSALFLPVLTPSFFTSPECRKELELFLEREKKLGRNDLVLPIYYLECPHLERLLPQQEDSLATILANRQWVNWRELRLEEPTSAQAARKIAEMAQHICEALARVPTQSEAALGAQP
jgi:hypothetical protein